MRRTIIALTIIGAVAAAAPATAQVNRRAMTQEQRIREGERSGQLTPAEARRLQFLEVRLQRTEARMRARNGGYLSPRQRYELLAMERRDSAEIDRLKHNRRVY